MSQAHAARILERCAALARLSEQVDGLTRVYLSEQHRAANALVAGWMHAAGMHARTDAIGNVVGRLEGERPDLPCLMLGSHLDTVRDAGRYDGMLGVVTALESIHQLRAGGHALPFAIEIVGFGDEEGVRFGTTLIGSRAMAGTLDPVVLETRDSGGVSLRDALIAFGLDPANVSSAARQRSEILAYVELHIEQGPVLESEDLPVGVVTAINGATRALIEVTGEAGHAGTVPMALRRDALAAAAECVLAIERRCAGEPGLVGTVGRIECEPGAINVIPGRVRFTLDLRAPDDAQRARAYDDVVQAIEACAKRRGLALDCSRTHASGTAHCAPWLQDRLASAIGDSGLRVLRLPSGAGHDGMAMCALADFGMLFVRCERGISHNPAEAVTEADVAVGLEVLTRFIERFGRR